MPDTTTPPAQPTASDGSLESVRYDAEKQVLVFSLRQEV
jgi:hypothetical protein